jgi:hypothetical protein
MRTRRRFLLPAFASLLAPLAALPATRAENEVGFIERFALAADRSKILGELVPGSEDYYFFHCLHYQNTRDREKLEQLLSQWKEREPHPNARRKIIENREALLSYDATPQQTLDYLNRELGIRHDHRQEQLDPKPDLPTRLDPGQVSREAYEREALQIDDSLAGLGQEALENLVRSRAPLKPRQRRALLSRLTRPDVANLAALIIADFKTPGSSGFGEFPIHRQLLTAQLDELQAAIPELANYEPFVMARLAKLAPSEDADVGSDPSAREAWLDRLLAYTRSLPPAFNTVKAQVLYQRLDHDRGKGVYDKDLLIEYLKLPRPFAYVNPKWLESRDRASEPRCDMSADLGQVLPGRRPAADDEALVRECLLAIFDAEARRDPGAAGRSMIDPYTPYVIDTWLKPVLGEALITGGHGDAERWASLLDPPTFQQLKDRVDIDFPATNPPLFQPGDEPRFDVILKNTPKLIVRTYEINTVNYFLTRGRQLNTDLDLDGLVAHSEKTYAIEEGPFRRTRRTFDFPELKGKRGGWIVEFIGGGRSSRALIRVGQWQVIQQSGPSGTLLLVLDEKSQPVRDAVAWVDGRKLVRDPELDRIVVPFTARPGRRPLVVGDAAGSFATLTEFDHGAETYVLDAQFHIEREQLLARKEAALVVRTALMLGEAHLDPALLLEPRLTITSTTIDGISTTIEERNIRLSAGSNLLHRISIPEGLAQLSVTLAGRIALLGSGGEKRELTASRSWNLNGICKTDATNDVHFTKFGDDHVVELLGRNGEPLADQQVVLAFTHRGFPRPQTVPLKTDPKGRILLGSLPGITRVSATLPNGRESSWEPATADRTWPSVIHAAAGRELRIPWTGGDAPDATNLPSRLSLLETKAGTFGADLIAKVAIKDGFLTISGLAPGDYSLRMRDEARDLTIRITEGSEIAGWLVGKNRRLELKDSDALHITRVAADDEHVTVRLANATPFTRVHIVASRFHAGKSLLAGLGGFTRFGASMAIPARNPNLYSEGRNIGDEYRYILERRDGKRFPGNMLVRPGLLLNPWAVRDTGLEEIMIAGMGQASQTAGGRSGRILAKEQERQTAPRTGIHGAAAQTNLDFLAAASPALYNLLPDKDGVVRILRKDLGDRQHVQILAEDLSDAAWQSFALPETETKFEDLRLARHLDPAKPFTQRRETTVLAKGADFTLQDILTGRMEVYDSLADIHALFTTLSGNAELAKFAWLLEWPKLKDEEKRAKYSEFACHELSFFLSRKDPAFFATVIKPYLANKKDKTFMDEYLLGTDLSRHTRPTEYARLNVVERALLGSRLKDRSPEIARSLREAWELISPNAERLNFLFETALRGRTMERAPAKPAEEGGGQNQGWREKMEAGIGGFADGAMTPSPAMAPPPGKEQTLNRARSGLSVAAADAEVLALEVDPFGEDWSGADKNEVDELRRSLDSRREALEKADNGYFGGEAVRKARDTVRGYYRHVGPTKEWAENNYWHLRIAEQDGDLVPVNAFWRDFAKWVADGAAGGFVSPHVAEAGGGFAEMMLALAVLDLPFESPKHEAKAAGGSFTLTAAGPAILFHKEIKPAAGAGAQQGQLLVSQSFFRAGDRFRLEGNERFEKYVTGEFLTGVVYGGNVVVTNPTSTPAKAEVLLQIPQGSLAVKESKATDSKSVRLEPYTTKTFEYLFYFPATGREPFAHFPAHVAVDGAIAGSAKPSTFLVVTNLTKVDTASWEYLSQFGSEAEVFAFLERNNLRSLALPRIAWRCRDAAFYRKLTTFLGRNQVWDDTIHSYALLHNDAGTLRDWILRREGFVAQCGPWLASRLVDIDPIERRVYEHLEYSPLVNQRAHRIGAEAKIANPDVLAQYRSFLEVLAHKPALDAVDHMGATYYLFLQDRVDEALAHFRGIDAQALPVRIQHDYFRCYAAFYEEKLDEARQIAARYADHPVDRWRLLFAAVGDQLDEIEGKVAASRPQGGPDRDRDHSALAAGEPSFDFKVEKQAIVLNYRNLREVTLNYYLMDPEFSFSSNPFVTEDGGRFGIIRPNRTAPQALPEGKDLLEIPLPADLAKSNVLVEVVGAGLRKTHACHANTLKIVLAENYGRIEVRDSGNDRAVSKAYVKVYARLADGTVRFFKDGYTDLRGHFDYASLNGPADGVVPVPLPQPRHANAGAPGGLDHQMLKPGELSGVTKLAILVLSETNGAATREVAPPGE